MQSTNSVLSVRITPAKRGIHEAAAAQALTLAVDRRYQRRGCGRSLLLFALTTSLRLLKEIGCIGVLTHPIDNDARLFYRQFDFMDVPGDPRRSMMVRMAELAGNAA